MNFASYFVAPWFIKVLFLFILFTLPIKEYEIASLSLHYIQGFGSMTSFSVTLSDSEGFKRDCHAFGSQMTVKRLAMTVKESSRW